MSEIDAGALSTLIHLIYAASTDPSKWRTFLERFSTTVGAAGTVLFMHDFGDSSVVRQGGALALMEYVRFDPASIDSYAAHYSLCNVWAQQEGRMRPGDAITSEMLVPFASLQRSEFYGDWLRPQDLAHALGGVVSKSGTHAIKFSAMRSRRGGAFGDDALRLYAALLPHIRQAFEIHKQFVALRAANAGQMHALDAMPMAVWMCGADCTVLAANRAARWMTDKPRGLRIDGAGRLRAQFPDDDAKLQHALARAAGVRTREPRVGTALGIDRLCSATRITAMVTPVHEATEGIDAQTTAVVFASDPDDGLCTPEELLCKVYGLTPHQARLAGWLMRGEDLKAYAQAHEVAYDTARSHLKQVFAKTGVNRQSDLIRVLLTSPALTIRPGPRPWRIN
ncbi:helix-turn-helix transcriptional regulator [Burkholderia guangdongensis]|uniref:helix-turn-helix transcriptional regulator n=1 Tax=Burkholderia guangdongensis TaxID=1792500 RepID=UPI0015C94AC9|nr:helix-turn-helix transcriptional regulator [Burkholderia guangdongensis]